MKLYTSRLSKLIKEIKNGNFKALLIHGENQGFATTSVEQISKVLNLIVTTFNSKELTPAKLQLVANNQNFFKQKELIKITGTTSALSKDMRELLSNNQFYHFICFVSSDPLPPNGIRKFFEEQPKLASLGCYYDNEQTVSKVILQQCNNQQKNIEEDALFYLKSHLKGDHQIIESELEKLFYFTHDKSVITKEDVLHTLSQELLANADKMCIFFSKKEPARFLKEIEKLHDQNKNEVLMIRALIRYYLNIYKITLKLEDGENLDHMIKTLSLPIFFKYIDEFKQIVRKYNSNNALCCLKTLQNAEICYKTNPQCFDLFSIYSLQLK